MLKRIGNTVVLGVSVLAGACSPERGGVDGSRTLATEAVKSALDNGGFQAIINQGVTQSAAVAKLRIEASGRQLTLEQDKAVSEVLRRVLLEVYPREAWEDALLPLYLENLSKDELRELVAFQGTPLGKKLLGIQASLATGGGGIGDRLMKSREADFTNRLSVELAAALKTGR